MTPISSTRILLCLLSFNLWLSHHSAQAQLPTGWKQHDMDRPRPVVVTPGESNLPLAPPSDAVVLFDGSSLDQWRSSDGGPAKWRIRDGVMESVPGSGYIYTEKSFGDVQLHVEWASPQKVSGRGQGRGNSGVFLQSLFEVQVLDSFDNDTYSDGQAASIYGQFPPLVNASRGPGEWQSYDILFRAPHYREDGELAKPARITVLHNGVLVQDNVEPLGPTSWILHYKYQKTEAKRPIGFQDHGNPVLYRNIWLRELPSEEIVQPEKPYDPVVVELSEEEIEKVAGEYKRPGGGKWKIFAKDGTLYFDFIGRPLEMIPHSASEYGLKYTAGILKVLYDADGNVTEVQFTMGGDTSKATRSP